MKQRSIVQIAAWTEGNSWAEARGHCFNFSIPNRHFEMRSQQLLMKKNTQSPISGEMVADAEQWQ